MPMFGQMTETLSTMDSSMRIEDDFFSVAITIPLVAGDPESRECVEHNITHP
jgi:hypothetical protein